jgi:uncharacterized membrane protein
MWVTHGRTPCQLRRRVRARQRRLPAGAAGETQHRHVDAHALIIAFIAFIVLIIDLLVVLLVVNVIVVYHLHLSTEQGLPRARARPSSHGT